MPGIAGYSFFERKSEEKDLLERMLQSIKHKPWHKKQSLYAPFLHIGRVHLGIFNPEQPVFNESRELFAFMYGKIYDYDIDKLKMGHELFMGNDPDFCLHAYEEYGKDFVKTLNGSFLLVIGDLQNKRVLIVNDRLGTRPLYYVVKEDGGIIFASEVKAILQSKSLTKEIDHEALAQYFVFGEILGDKTLFRGIKVLPPASILTSRKADLRIGKYWDLIHDYEDESNNTENSLVDGLVETLKNSVSKRLKGPHRYGHSLSGGLDSRAILSAASDAERRNLVAFTFGESGCDEIRIARIVADRLNVKHVIIEFKPSDLTKYFEEAVYLTDGMNTVVVSLLPYAFERLRKFADVFSFDIFLDLLLAGNYLDASLFRVKSDLELANLLYSKRGNLFSEGLLSRLLTKEYYRKVKGKAYKSLLTEIKQSKGKTFADKSDHFFAVNHLRRYVNMGIVIDRNYLESSCPTSDNEFFDLLLKIPPKLRMNRRIYVKFLKRLAPEMARIPYEQTLLPASAPFMLWKLSMKTLAVLRRVRRIIWRVSKGRILVKDKLRYIHLDQYMRANEQWKRVIHKILLTKEAEIYKRGIFKMEGVRRLIEEHESGKADHWRRIAFLTSFELFIRMFL